MAITASDFSGIVPGSSGSFPLLSIKIERLTHFTGKKLQALRTVGYFATIGADSKISFAIDGVDNDHPAWEVRRRISRIEMRR